MSVSRGISQKIVYGHNPNPRVSEAELLKEAKLDMITPSTLDPFSFGWKYDREYLTISAGEYVPLRASEADEFLLEFGDRGAVIIQNQEDEAEVRKASIEGLRRAQKRFKAAGAVLVLEYRKRHGITKEEAEERRHDLWAYHLNEAKASACEAQIRRLQTPSINRAK